MRFDQDIEEYIKRKHYRQINSVLVLQDDALVAQRYYIGYSQESRNVIKSVAKSIMSIGTGIALDQGHITSLEEPIYKFIPEFSENRDPRHRLITIRHLLTMTSGIYWNGGIHYHCPMLTQLHRSKDWISHIADCAVSNTPGTKYVYKEWDVILLAKLLEVACGDLYDYLNTNLYLPLNIISDRWYQSNCGVYYSVAYGEEEEGEIRSNLTALEMLRIGQLFLKEGSYEGRQNVSKSYLHQAIAPSTCNSGYGLLWWRGEDWYGCRGYGGQSITVVPKKNAVIVTQATPTPRGMGYDDLIRYCVELISH